MATDDIAQGDTPGDRRVPGSAAAADTRKPWITPVVTASDPRKAGAHVALGSDGTSSIYGAYGS